MIQICNFPNCNGDTGDYDVIKPENSTLRGFLSGGECLDRDDFHESSFVLANLVSNTTIKF